MTNTRQIGTSQGRDFGETNVMNHDLVMDHIDTLMREGDALRAERREAEHRAAAVGSGDTRRPGRIRPARVRLGRWLVGVGWAVAGSSGDSQETAGHAV
jgi:hypothetical protein